MIIVDIYSSLLWNRCIYNNTTFTYQHIAHESNVARWTHWVVNANLCVTVVLLTVVVAVFLIWIHSIVK